MAKTYANFNNLINFTRSTSGTALRPVSYGTELVTNGTFDSDSDWTKEAAWTISNGVASFDASVNANLQQANIGMEVGKIYQFRFEITAGADANFSLFASGSGDQYIGYIDYAVGTHAVNFICTGGDGVRIAASKFIGSSFSIDNISVKEVLFDQPSAPLTLFNHPADIPRIEYDADGNRLGLLIEEARTNLVTYSEDFSNAAWSGYWQKPTFVTGQLAPDGSYTAMKWNASTTTGSSSGAYGGLVFGQGQATAGVTYTASVWLKASASVNMSLGLTDGATTIITLTNEWVRYSYTGESVGTLRLFQLNENTNEDIDIYIWGAQTEQGSFPTSYIPTSGATATRAADLASIPVSAFGYNKSEGTLVGEISYFNSYTGSPFPRALTLRRTFGVRESVEVLCFNNNISLSVYDENVSSFGYSISSVNSKFAVTFRENDFAGCFDGLTVYADTSGGMPEDISILEIGRFSGSAYLNGHIKSIQYYPRRLTNTQLQELTS